MDSLQGIRIGICQKRVEKIWSENVEEPTLNGVSIQILNHIEEENGSDIMIPHVLTSKGLKRIYWMKAIHTASAQCQFSPISENVEKPT